MELIKGRGLCNRSVVRAAKCAIDIQVSLRRADKHSDDVRPVVVANDRTAHVLEAHCISSGDLGLLIWIRIGRPADAEVFIGSSSNCGCGSEGSVVGGGSRPGGYRHRIAADTSKPGNGDLVGRPIEVLAAGDLAGDRSIVILSTVVAEGR